MKKILFVFIFLLAFPICASAANRGNVVETDIVTYIDNSPIESYNYEGFTYVIVEDLKNYGFNIVWNESTRALSITRDKYVYAPYVADFINQKKQACIGKARFGVYDTDIKTYLNGNQITAYNIDGKTIVSTDYLQEFGNCTYNDETRRYDVDILGKEIEKCEEKTSEGMHDYDPYGPCKSTQKGIFENGELIYGIKKIDDNAHYGQNLTIESGDFKNKKTIKYASQYMGREESVTYETPTDTRYVIMKDTFKYGKLFNYLSEKKDGGKTYRYLRSTGEMYLVTGNTDTPADNLDTTKYKFGFNGQLYKNGKLIYDGWIDVDTFSFLHDADSGETKINVLYARNYTDSDGIIYYSGCDNIYYKGNVVNGVAHGKGAIYSNGAVMNNNYRVYGDKDEYTGTYYAFTEHAAEPLTYVDNSMIYCGEFKDGLMNGYGEMYKDGHLIHMGTWINNVPNGHIRSYETTTDGNGKDAIYLWFDGNVTNDIREGYGIQYAVKGLVYYEGIYAQFVGEWKGNRWTIGKEYAVKYDAQTNTNIPYLVKEGDCSEDYAGWYYPEG